jgi:hypothetical protein
MSTHHQRLVDTLRAHGIVYPESTITAAHTANMDLWVACTNLQLETSGGRNVFGHDPTSSIPASWKGTTVTRAKYLVYKAARGRLGLQGVGPCQLTSAGLQDQADRLGGCWRPEKNMIVGFRFLHALIKQWGSVRLGFQHYNGSGPAAVLYGRRAADLVHHWRLIIEAVR